MKLTREIIHGAGSSKCGFNSYQLRLLGVGYPPAKGWLYDLIGTEVSDRTWELVVRLKARGYPEARKALLKLYGVDPVKLFQSPIRGPINL